jgi:ubiquinone/menaquinone biosynthesis C-methylase UbiE
MNIKDVLISMGAPVAELDRELISQTNLLIAEFVKPKETWLDLGCGLKPYASKFGDCAYIGIDVEVSGREGNLKSADVYFDGSKIPFSDATFDGILCTQVLEHVSNVEDILSESKRVLKKDGIILLTVPFIYREHEQPFDFRRFTSFGLIATFENNGFTIEKIKKSFGAVETITMLTNSYISKNISSRSKVSFILGSVFIFFNSVLGKTLSKLLPDNGEMYCNLILAARNSRLN